MIGTVLFWRNQGWGFLQPEDLNEPDIYCHIRGLNGVRHLAPGQRVKYEVSERNGKPLAVDVRLLTDETSANGGRQ
jgi:cold shock CspA family protein